MKTDSRAARFEEPPLMNSLDADADSKGKSHPALLALRAEAARKGLTVLLRFGEAMRPELAAALATLPDRAEIPLPALEKILRRPEPWGLNE